MPGPSETQNNWVTRVLNVRLPEGTGSGTAAQTVSVMKLGKARIEWRDTLAAARGEMQALKQAVVERYAGVEDSGSMVGNALAQLDQAMSELDDTLFQQLDAVLTADAASRPPLITVATGTMSAFLQHVGSDPVMAELDGNEIRPSTAITGPIRAKLNDIAAAFS